MERESNLLADIYYLNLLECKIIDRAPELVDITRSWQGSENGRHIRVPWWNIVLKNNVLALYSGLNDKMGSDFKFFQRIRKNGVEVLVPSEWQKK